MFLIKLYPPFSIFVVFIQISLKNPPNLAKTVFDAKCSHTIFSAITYGKKSVNVPNEREDMTF